MRNRHAKFWWWFAGVFAFSLTAVGTASADTIYFKNNTSMWGEEAEEEGNEVLLTRGGQTLRFPKADVDRIEKKTTNMPSYRVDLPPPGPAAPGAGQGQPGPGGPGAPPGGPAATPGGQPAASPRAGGPPAGGPGAPQAPGAPGGGLIPLGPGGATGSPQSPPR